MAGAGAAVPLGFEEFFEQTRTGYVVMSLGGDIIRANTVLAGWLGVDPASLQGKQFADCLAVAGKIYFETHLSPLLHMQGYFDEVSIELAGSAGRVPVLVNGILHRNADDTLRYVVMSFFQSTERRRYERDLLSARNELREANKLLSLGVASEARGRVEAETSLSTERQVSALREQFIAVLGHDLRNPVAGLDGGLNMLEKTPLNDRAKMLTGMMRSSLKRMDRLISDVMDFARARMGGGILVAHVDTELRPVLLQVLEELQLGRPDRVLTADIQVDRVVRCDPIRVAQLVSNLLSNAVTHGAEDRPVRLEARLVGDAVEISVVNEGAEIPAETIEHLFEPYTREDARPSQQGLGLGLYIASEIAKAHHGHLSATSSPDETRFTFHMPIQPPMTPGTMLSKTTTK